MNTECKRCLLRESGEKDAYKSVSEKIERIKPEERTPEDIYRFRLSQCRKCSNLLSGVCMQCGCYPELRAAFNRMKCADTSGNRWFYEQEENDK